jgi:putative two-component system response regulator
MAKVLVVDDDAMNREVLEAALEAEGFEVVAAADGPGCLAACRREPVGTVLLDVMMPGMDGFEVCRALKRDDATALIPVLLVTALGDRASRVRGIEAGADDFLTKPVDRAELVPRVRSALRTHQLIGQAETVYSLAASLSSALEARDSYTREHAGRVASYALATAERLGLGRRERRDVYLAGLLHDIGKVGVPDAILTKPGPLTAEEFAVIHRHPEIGARICEATRGLEIVAAAVRGHHERWDGGGYPTGLAGEAIPLVARVVAVADAFDAMTSDRPYHRAIPVGAAFEEVGRCRASQFDPAVVEAFLAVDVQRVRVEAENAARLSQVLIL